ncbi:MAG TPA: alpha/beta hydrolase [Rubrivivax sp.]|nr:alpha/beta hydrolase [Rubrivivax sp.]
MLAFTNRTIATGSDATAFSTRFRPNGIELAAATAQRSAGGWQLGAISPDISDDDAVRRLVPLFRGNRPVLLYLHGNNNSPGTCFERCARLEETYGVEVVAFSWPSEGHLASGVERPGLPVGTADAIGDDANLAGVKDSNARQGSIQRKILRYHQAKINAQESADALARLSRLLGTARLYANRQKLSIAAHSLGAQLLQYGLGEMSDSASLGAVSNIVLIAACTRAEGHAAWLQRMRPAGQVFVTYNQGDLVLFGAYIADKQQTKLGAEPGTKATLPWIRYVSFTNAQVGAGGHRYFIAESGKAMPRHALKLFKRIFSSEPDLRPEELGNPRLVYPVGCDTDGLTCYMHAP